MSEVMNPIMTEGHILIIGNGIAGVSAAETIRKNSKTVQITIVDKEVEPVYYKPMLSKLIAKEELPRAFYLHDEAWYEKENIRFIRPATVTAILPQEKEVSLSDGQVLSYDRLILATGAECFVPPINNAHLEGVFTLRTLQDARRIKEKITQSKNAVVIGGGLLGLELAAEIAEGGVYVSVIEMMDRLLPRQLDEKGAAILERAFHTDHIRVMKSAGVESILGNEAVNGVMLKDGSRIEADLVIISAGVRSDMSLYTQCGIRCERSIIVDAQMRTNLDAIFACGDNACFENANYAIWPQAINQGQIAGFNALGINKEYEHFVPSTMFNGMNLRIFSIGMVNYDEEDQDYSFIVYENDGKQVYKKLIFYRDELVGGILIGDNKKTKMLTDGIKNHLQISDLLSVFA